MKGLPVAAWLRYSIKETLASPGRLLLGGFAAFARAFGLALAWGAMGKAAGLEGPQLAALTLFPLLVLAFPITEVKSDFQAEITSGQIASRLTLPARLYAHYGFKMLGRWLCAAVFAWPWVGLGLLLLGAAPRLDAPRLASALLLAGAGAGVLALERLLIEGCAFWLKETFGLNHLHNSLRLALSGALIPPAALPEALRAPFLHSPYAIGVGLPVRVLSDPSFRVDLGFALGLAAAYGCALLCLLSWQARSLDRHVFVNGG